MHVLPRFAVSFAILAWGYACARRAARARIGEADWDVTAMAAAVYFALALTLPALVLGTFGWLRAGTWAAAAIVSFALLARTSSAPGPVPSDAGSAPSKLFVTALGGFTIGRMLFSLRNPPADWDSFHYHLPMIAAWQRTGFLSVPMHVPPPFGQYFPGSGELLETWMAWSTGRDTLVTWVGIVGLSFLALAVRRLALLAGSRAGVAEACALLASAAPGVAQLTMGAKVDHLLAAWFATALLFAMRYRAHRSSADLGLTLCAVALLPGVKSTGPVYALMALGVAIAARGAAARVGDLLRHRAALLTAIFAGGYWYARNALSTGNPLYPAGSVIAGRTLPGLLDHETLRRTMQAFVWLEGHGGHFTLPHLVRWFGPGIVALALGVALWLVREARAGGDARHEPLHRRAALFALLSAACFVFYLFTPFSGLYLPAVHGEPLRLNLDNLRLLLPTAVTALPLAALGFSSLGGGPVVAAVLSLAWLAGLGLRLAHVVPGIAIAALLAWGSRATRQPGPWRIATRWAAGTAAVVGISFAVAIVDPLREAGEARAWDGFLPRIQNLRWEPLRKLREDSRDRPLAIVGPASWWALYGRDFSGRPAYVPVASRESETDRPFRLLPENRQGADHDLWLANLRESGARYVVISGLGDSCDAIPEQAWCRDDTARFQRVDSARCTVAYRVRETAAVSPAAARTPKGAR